jgi:hypothetical protein
VSAPHPVILAARKHWSNLPPHVKDRETAILLIALVEAAATMHQQLDAIRAVLAQEEAP